MSGAAVLGSAPDGRRLGRNALLNLAGDGLPLVAAVAAIPLLIERLGVERFGILTLAWAVVGYLGFFDLGLGRAVTKLVAERLGTDREREVPAVAWTALLATLGLGIVAGVALALGAPQIERALGLSGALGEEARIAFYLLAASLPVAVTLPVLRGLLEAQQRFGLVNAVRLPLGVLTFVGPLLAAGVSPGLVAVVGAVIAARALAWLVLLVMCLRSLPGLRRRPSFEGARLGELLRFGGWLTVSGVVGPLMLTFDRFAIGAVLSVAAVAYYTTPFDAVFKLLVVPTALVSVLFPAFAAHTAADSKETLALYRRGLRYTLVGLFPLVLILVAASGELLGLWLGPEFAARSERPLQILAVAMLVNGLTMVPFALLQARGRADLTAKVHVVELAAYLPLLFLMMGLFGITGAALAWLARASIEALVFFVLAARLVPGTAQELRPLAVLAPCLVAALGVAALAPAPLDAIFAAVALAFFAAACRRLLAGDERATLGRRAGSGRLAGHLRRRAA